MPKMNYTVARVQTRTRDSIGKYERHNERKNEYYQNTNVDLSQTHNNVHFKSCGDMTYNEYLDKLVAEGKVSLRGLKKDAKVFDEMILDVNTDYFEEHGGYEFAKEFASCGVQVISGLARGIDGWAHKGAIDGGGETFAVLGCGVDICYPSQNINLYREIQKKGGIISEYEEGEKPLGWHFPLRNRIISGLADIVLVIEAKKKSGSLITVEYALEQGKSVYALPGRVGEALSEGCNNLIFQGAQIAKNVEIILEELEILDKMTKEKNKKTEIRLARKEEMVYSCVDLKPKHLDEIIKLTDLELLEVQEILVKLELMELVTEPIKNYYARAGG